MNGQEIQQQRTVREILINKPKRRFLNGRFNFDVASLDENFIITTMTILEILGGIAFCAICLWYWAKKARPDKIMESASELAHYFFPRAKLTDCLEWEREEIPSNVRDGLKLIERGHKSVYKQEVKEKSSWDKTDDGVIYLYTNLTTKAAAEYAREYNLPLTYAEMVTQAVIFWTKRKHPTYTSNFDSSIRTIVTIYLNSS